MADQSSSTHPINGFSIFTLVLFFVINILVVFPIFIPLPIWLTRFLIQAARKCRVISPADKSTLFYSAPHQLLSTRQAPLEAPTEKNGPTDSKPSATPSTISSTSPMAVNSMTGDAIEKDEMSEKRYHFPLGLSTAPVVGVFLLLATTSIPGGVVRTGIVGSKGVKPYDIMTLFISLAYISISLDCTGLLRYLAFWVALKGGTSGKRLYFFFFLFFFFFGVVVGNDPIILSGTSFLAYFCRIAGISPPRAWIFMQFASCNIASAVLVSSNPTNLVLTGAYDISFLVFSAWTILPVLATGAVLFPLLLWFIFRSETLIPARLEKPDVQPRMALIDKNGAIFGSILLGITLALLVGLSAGGLLHGVQGVWAVTGPAAIIMLVRDLIYDGAKHRGVVTTTGGAHGSGRSESLEMQGIDDLSGAKGMAEAGRLPSPTKEETRQLESAAPTSKINKRQEMTRRKTRDVGVSTSDTQSLSGSVLSQQAQSMTTALPIPAAAHVNDPSSDLVGTTAAAIPLHTTYPPAQPNVSSSVPCTSPPHKTLQSGIQYLSHRFPTFSHVFTRLPLPLLPFAFSMFTLVEALYYTGWIRVFGGWWTSWVNVSGLAGAIFLMGVLSVIGCNAFGTNIGATILLSRVLQEWSNKGDVSKRILFGSLYTLALGSNYGAFSYTFSASLAGLLWKGILAQKGIHVGRWEFARSNMLIILACMIVGCLIVAAEVCVIY